MNRLFFTFVLLIFSLPVMGQEVAFGVRGESLPVSHLTTLRAEVDEAEDQFVTRIGAFLDRYTRENGFEACAPISTVGDMMIARVSTSHSQVGCLVVLRKGEHYLGRSIHSHPEATMLRLTENDNVFLRGNGTAGKGRVFSLRRKVGPSDTDRQHEGYLVEAGVVTFHSPGQPDRIVGPVAESHLPPSVFASQVSY